MEKSYIDSTETYLLGNAHKLLHTYSLQFLYNYIQLLYIIIK